VNSPGGSVTASLAIIDTMGFVAPRLSTECAGQAGGMALLIAAAGARGLRFATPTARLAFAQFVPARQTASALERREMERLEHVTCELFARFTGQDLTSIERFCHEAHSVRAEAAIQLGLIDQLRG
jgi:ATP-dependent Clp protease protease subunit